MVLSHASSAAVRRDGFLAGRVPRIPGPGPDTAAIPTLYSGRAAHVPEPIMFLRRSSGSLFVRAEG